MKILSPLSGGKDSQGTLLYCIEKYGVENVEADFCDVKWEHPWTYQHLDYLVRETGVNYKILSSAKYDGFVDLVIQKKRFPSSTVGFCTEELKVKPMIDYILTLKESVMIFQGIRKDESRKRSKMSEDCRFFKYYFEPYQTNEMIVGAYLNNLPKSPKQFAQLEKAKARLGEGKNDEKYFTYRKNEVFEWCKHYGDDIYRPFFNSTADEIISYSLNRGYRINPLYFKGFTRVGCFPCKNATLNEMEIIVREFPETIDKIRAAELAANGTFFAPDYIPKRYLTGFDPKSGKAICKIDDVVRYIKDRTVQYDMLEDLELERGCASVYNICE
jgi:3'-phosphoadenosine 5'-phosphosulfate sulfotransferase (PAPS reductase)/FAD synthetase